LIKRIYLNQDKLIKIMIIIRNPKRIYYWHVNDWIIIITQEKWGCGNNKISNLNFKTFIQKNVVSCWDEVDVLLGFVICN